MAIDLDPPRRRLQPLLAGGGADSDEVADTGAEERWYLRVENLVGRPEAVAYEIHLDPDGPGDEESRHVGTVAAFGIMEASRTSDTRDGTGVTDVFDVTEAVRGSRPPERGIRTARA